LAWPFGGHVVPEGPQMTTPDLNPSGVDRLRGLAPATYLMAVLLVMYPLLQVSAGMDSFSPGEVRWRYGATGLLMDASLLPLFGALLALGTAHLFDQRRTQVALQALGGILLVLMAVMTGLFVLDALQLRGSVRPEVIPLYDRLSLKALAMLITDMLFLGTLSYTSFLATRRIRRAERAARRAPAHPEIRVPTPSQR
jgi:hypothetical protein